MSSNLYLFDSVLVCDNGSYTLKVGFSGDDSPRSVIPTIVGKPRKEMSIVGYGQRELYAGLFAKDNRGILDINSPIQDGIITDWEAMEEIWYHMFYEELLIPPEKYPILLTEPVGNPTSCQEKLVEIMFELFNVPSLRLVTKTTLALYGYGKTSGLVVDSGYENTQVVPIYEGFPLLHAVRCMPVGGLQVTEYLARLLNRRGYTFNTPTDQDILRYIKENFCYCAMDFERQLGSYNKKNEQRYTLPDGMDVEVNTEAFRSPELLFDPALDDIESPHGGMHNMVYKSISSCKIDDQTFMYNNIVLNGGTTLFPFLPERLKKSISSLALSTTNIKINSYPERNYSSWVGGSILGSSPNFEQSLVKKHDYEERGAKIVHEKCFL